MVDEALDPRDMTASTLVGMGYERTSRGDAIRSYCVDVCMCRSRNEVLLCASGDCPLWLFCMGTDPWREKREMTDEERAAAGERLRLAREARS